MDKDAKRALAYHGGDSIRSEPYPPWPDYDEREVCSGLRGIEVGEARPAKRLTGKSIRTGFRREV